MINFLYNFLFPIVFGPFLFFPIHVLFEVFHFGPLRAPDYGVVIGVTTFIVTIMFPIAILLKEKKDKERERPKGVVEVDVNAVEHASSLEISTERLSIIIWRIFFNIVTILPAIISMTLFCLWGGIYRFAREQYAVALHLIVFSFLMAAFFSLYDMEWEGVFWKHIFLFQSQEKNKAKFDRFMKIIKISKIKVVNIDNLKELPKNPDKLLMFRSIVISSAICAAFSVIPFVYECWEIYKQIFILYLTSPLASAGYFYYYTGPIYLFTFFLAVVFIFSFGFRSACLDYRFFRNAFSAIIVIIFFAYIFCLIVRDNFEGFTVSLLWHVFVVLFISSAFSSIILKMRQHKEIKKIFLNNVENVENYNSLDMSRIINYYIEKLNTIIKNNENYRKEIKNNNDDNSIAEKVLGS